MYVIRNVLKCKPGKAGEVIAKFKTALPMMQEIGRNTAFLLMRWRHFGRS